MIIVALLYKTGGDYTPDDVTRLALALRRNLTVLHRIVCMTDDPATISKIDALDGVMTLNHDLPGWWSKMELFKIHGPVLYFDLDTIITGNIDALTHWVIKASSEKDLLMLRGFYRQDQCSGIMGWNRSMHWIFSKFIAQSKIEFMHSDIIRMRWGKSIWRGDQEWLRAVVISQLNVTMAQDVQSGIVSYKVDVAYRAHKDLPYDANIVCFHGKPRPCEMDPIPKWMEEHWRVA